MAAAPDPSMRQREEWEAKVRFFSEYLQNNREEWEKKIDSELANGGFRLPLDLAELRKAEPGLDNKILQDPVKYLVAYEEALLNFFGETNQKALKSLKQPLKLDLKGSFGRNHVTPRGITASNVGQLMCVEGIVTKCSVSAPKLLQSMHVHKDRDDGYVESRDHRDATSLVANPRSGGGFPTQDSEGNELQMDVSLSVYKDSQTFTIQEAPDNSPPGQIPRNVQVICDGDLADKARPGDRVQVIGVYRSFPPPMAEFTTGVFPAKLVATSISRIKDLIEPDFVSQDVTNIRKISQREDTFKLLARSFAPAICGHGKVKEGLLLQMIGGTEKNLSNGTHLRGDINVLMVGDPSCGKSQMLRFVMNTAPLAISTTGRGSSGVGLTAAMIRDTGTREFNLEAGAMVLADRGVICIDEFDKMGQNDRVSIHEAMEQQCVTIAKAGMHVTLNARCSVVAAANPIYGNFDPSLDLAKNIGLPDSLLSRFDLVYVVRDTTTEEIDRRIATQVLRQCSMRGGTDGRMRGVEEIHSSILERRSAADKENTQQAAKVFEDTMPVAEGEDAEQVVTVDFLQKYIRFAKRYKPILSPEAQAAVADKYVDMRMRFQSGFADLSAGQEGNPDRKPRLAVTTRTLEALIRLATAHAKLKLRKDHVLEEDVLEAYRLMLAAREEEVPVPPPGADAPIEGDEDGGDDGDEDPRGPRGRKRQREEATEAEGEAASSTAIVAGRFDTLRLLVARCFSKKKSNSIGRSELLEMVNAELAPGEPQFVQEEYDAGLLRLEEENKIMLEEASNEVFHVS
mmetsp:Transcript_87181/g.154384  ORF Transcript_87181/g.154384 Transcript_87181/m.154384 type:complete len:796 (+) Transcript_87181:66-2453(+)|eukprot:CAMPEP_0197621042 /NCGR_PEP_ID=MMETSP1338-20131121/1682_1 /TAXON_ID=43686 ORGANISM="Pelagodinium beii, Strain RCC1491" /NCGR_SAMPLE_ID=MMETSP1338 /ASSEMBLY_ACC=CAM_ASM_000754 /LENGTH=795 /DNA_ID=CAMNT_0043190367 /DNA_START=67 /DNA_END=2454 /DNA_ORIENTATION=-